jgi:hypothetical protein
MTNNVFKFPEHKIVREVPVNVEEVEAAKEKGKQNFADDILSDFIDGTLTLLENYGIDTEGAEFEKDFSFTVESIKATIYRSLKLNHHLHEFIEKSVMVVKKGEAENSVLELPEETDDIIIEDANDIGKLDNSD